MDQPFTGTSPVVREHIGRPHRMQPMYLLKRQPRQRHHMGPAIFGAALLADATHRPAAHSMSSWRTHSCAAPSSSIRRIKLLNGSPRSPQANQNQRTSASLRHRSRAGPESGRQTPAHGFFSTSRRSIISQEKNLERRARDTRATELLTPTRRRAKPGTPTARISSMSSWTSWAVISATGFAPHRSASPPFTGSRLAGESPRTRALVAQLRVFGFACPSMKAFAAAPNALAVRSASRIVGVAWPCCGRR